MSLYEGDGWWSCTSSHWTTTFCWKLFGDRNKIKNKKYKAILWKLTQHVYYIHLVTLFKLLIQRLSTKYDQQIHQDLLVRDTDALIKWIHWKLEAKNIFVTLKWANVRQKNKVLLLVFTSGSLKMMDANNSVLLLACLTKRQFNGSINELTCP